MLESRATNTTLRCVFVVCAGLIFAKCHCDTSRNQSQRSSERKEIVPPKKFEVKEDFFGLKDFDIESASYQHIAELTEAKSIPPSASDISIRLVTMIDSNYAFFKFKVPHKGFLTFCENFCTPDHQRENLLSTWPMNHDFLAYPTWFQPNFESSQKMKLWQKFSTVPPEPRSESLGMCTFSRADGEAVFYDRDQSFVYYQSFSLQWYQTKCAKTKSE